MSRTILQLVSTACYRSGIPVPASLVGATDTASLQLLHLFYSVGEELRSLALWPQLKRTFKIRLVYGQQTYDLPADFYCSLPFTHYDRANSWAICGPMTDADWNLRVIGTDFQGTTKAFRLFGHGSRQFSVDPLPGAGDANAVISFDYISRSWIQPPAWTASESISQNTWRSAAGRLYKKLTAGSQTTGTYLPTMAFGEGTAGAVTWFCITTTAWSQTIWSPGQYVTNGGNVYVCTAEGTSSGTGPTGTSSSPITEGTVTWNYVPTPAWVGGTAYETGDHVSSGGQYFRVEKGGQSGLLAPPWTATTVTDGSVVWTHQNVAYEEAVGDTDVCSFDEELVIAGLRAAFFASHGMGNEELVVRYEQMKKRAVARWNRGKVLDLAAGTYSPRPFANLPEGNWPTW